MADAAAVLEYVGLGPAVVVGHSLGGVDAYRLAARRPDLVRAVAVEDIGAVEGIGAVDDDLSHAPGNCVRLGGGEGFYDALRGFLARV